MFSCSRVVAVVVTGLLAAAPAAGQVRVTVKWEFDVAGVTNEMDAADLSARVDALNDQWTRQLKTIIPVFEFVATAPGADDIQLSIVAKSLGTQLSSELWTGFQIRLPGTANAVPMPIALGYKPNEFQTMGGTPSEKLDDLVKRFYGLIFEIDTDNKRAELLPKIPLGQSLEQCFKDSTGAVDTKRSVIRVSPTLWRKYAASEFAVEYLTSQGRKETQVNGTGKLHEVNPNGVIVSHDPLVDVNMWLKITIKRWYEMNVPASSGQTVSP
jgi:hypothetical protein